VSGRRKTYNRDCTGRIHTERERAGQGRHGDIMTTSTKRSRSAVTGLLCCFRDGSARDDEEKATAAKPAEAESKSKGDSTTTKENPKPDSPGVSPAEPASSSGNEAARPKEFAHQYAVSFPSSFTDPWDVYELLDDKLGEGKYALRVSQLRGWAACLPRCGPSAA